MENNGKKRFYINQSQVRGKKGANSYPKIISLLRQFARIDLISLTLIKKPSINS